MQEREARLETKRRNERSSISFAFGSSTPRLLDPVDVSLMTSSGTYWGHRRSTSISNVSYANGAPLSRRSSERELSDAPKKRATSAGGLDRPEGKTKTIFTYRRIVVVVVVILVSFIKKNQTKTKFASNEFHFICEFMHT